MLTTMARCVTGVAFEEGGLWSQSGIATISPSILSSGESSIDNWSSDDIVADRCMCVPLLVQRSTLATEESGRQEET
jgi:hypothetical protein